MNTEIKYISDQGDIKFFSKNHLYIENHIEFAKTFQVGSKKAKGIQEIYFDLEKDLGSSDLILKNVKINSSGNFTNSDDIFIVKNIQNLRSYIRKVID